MSDTKLTELVDPDVESVHAVPEGANGFPVLLLKAVEDPELAAEVGRALDADEAITTEDPVTKTETPETPAAEAAAAAAEPSAAAAGEPVAKADPEAVQETEEPGSPAWEAADAARLRECIDLVLQLRRRLEAACSSEAREAYEGDYDEDDWDNMWALSDALTALECVLTTVATLAVLEQDEATEGVEKSQARQGLPARDRANVRKAITTLQGLLDGRPATKEDSVSEPVTKTEGEQPAAAATTEEASEPTAAASTEEQPAEEVTKAGAAPTTDTPAASEAATDVAALLKGDEFLGLLKSTLEPVIKAAVKPLEDRLEVVEKQPMPGGPFLRGTTDAHDFYLVRKGEPGGVNVAADAAPEEIAKALDQIKDPVVRDQVGRSLAGALHPALRQG